ncbi:MAG: mono/diheme cytochrome c family protein [Phenylobacterium sp.]|jgi:mono/diheme cytochrome c family protein
MGTLIKTTKTTKAIKAITQPLSMMLVIMLCYSSYATADEQLIQRGKTLYSQNCVFCHQADAIGKPGMAPSLTNPQLLSIASDKFLMTTIRDGRAGTSMPPYGHLGRKGISEIVAYLRSHQTLPNRAAEVDAQRAAQGDPRKGQLWFDDICATCHGVKGDGYLAGGSGTAIGKPGFLSKASDGFIRETIKHGRENTRMLPFAGPEGLANLNPQEIEDIISYMRTLK